MRVGWVNQVLQAPCTEPETLRHAEQPHCVGNKNGINSAAENRLNQPFFHHPRSHVSDNSINWLISAVVGTISGVIGFAVAAFIINMVGRAAFNADVTFEELVRTMGLAYVWNGVGVIGALSVFSPTLSCLLAPGRVLAWILLVIAWFMAVKEALDLEWGQTIVTVILGWIAWVVIMAITGAVLGLLGLTAAGLGGLLSF